MKKAGIESGIHLIMDCFGCDKKLLNNSNYVRKVINTIRKKIKMDPLTKIIVKKGTPYLPGRSGFQMIQTSHITCHTFSDWDYVAIDVYSCKKYNPLVAINYFKKMFKPKKTKSKIIRRPM